MKSILYVSPFAYGVSGADESLLQIIRRLPRDSWTPHLALPPHSPYRKRFKEAGVIVHPFFLLRLKRTINPIYWLFFCLWLPVEVISFAYILKRHRIDLIHINMESTISAAIAGRLLSIPVIFHYRGKTRDTPKLFFDLFLPLLCRLADHIFVISEATRTGFKNRGLPAKTEVLYNALDLSSFSAKQEKNYFLSRGLPFSGKKVAVFLGRLDPQKRIVDLIDAAVILQKSNPDLVIAVFGGDPKIPEEAEHQKFLQGYLARKGSPANIHFLGIERNVPHVLQSSDLLVLPAIDEGFGRVVVEGMAAGIPVVVANSGAPPELVQHGTYGTIVPPCQPELLAQAMAKILNSPESHRKADAARAYAQKTFDITTHVEKLISRYKSCMKEVGTS